MRTSGLSLPLRSSTPDVVDVPLASTSVVTVTGSSPLSVTVVDTVAAFSVVTHFDGFQRGVIDARDLLFFLSVIGFALFATGVVIRSHRSG